ncbi:unnamed protein product [Prorocentrum cordatum]|uniref:Uncharacterized protein n=1 Tax=Prorocentrum cordatum TaxID=2364126 RepID=A0ABN9PX66_9DINO|nr:unnamed protein product [Polarella glacialis]
MAALVFPRPQRFARAAGAAALALGCGLLAGGASAFAAARPGGLRPAGGAPAAGRERGGRPTALAALGWLPDMPQMCEDDYECNGGKANFPLRCLDAAIAKICVDPDDFLRPTSEAAYEPLVVRPDSHSDPRRAGRQ